MINKNPAIVHGGMLVESIKEVIADLQEKNGSEAYRKLKHLLDSLFPICYTTEDGAPIQAKKDSLKIHTQLNDFTELDALKKNGKCRVQIDLVSLSEDLERIRYQVEKNNYPEARESLEGILVELEKIESQKTGNTGSKYEFLAESSDLILKARTELGEKTKTLYAKYIEEEECKKLLEKYIAEAYDLGQKEMKEEMTKKTE